MALGDGPAGSHPGGGVPADPEWVPGTGEPTPYPGSGSWRAWSLGVNPKRPAEDTPGGHMQKRSSASLQRDGRPQALGRSPCHALQERECAAHRGNALTSPCIQHIGNRPAHLARGDGAAPRVQSCWTLSTLQAGRPLAVAPGVDLGDEVAHRSPTARVACTWPAASIRSEMLCSLAVSSSSRARSTSDGWLRVHACDRRRLPLGGPARAGAPGPREDRPPS